MKLWLGWEEDDIACYDENGKLMEDYANVVMAHTQAEERADAEAQARAVAEQHADAEAQARTEMAERVRQLEAELRRLRGDTNNG